MIMVSASNVFEILKNLFKPCWQRAKSIVVSMVSFACYYFCIPNSNQIIFSINTYEFYDELDLQNLFLILNNEQGLLLKYNLHNSIFDLIIYFQNDIQCFCIFLSCKINIFTIPNYTLMVSDCMSIWIPKTRIFFLIFF